MTDKDREKWNSRYLKQRGGLTPSSILMKFWGLASCGKALDIACGNGRNSIFLAKKGFVVDAVDISTVATNRLAGENPNIHVACLDIDSWQIIPNRYDLIVNVRFLDRRLFPMIREGLKPGGVLIFESFLDGHKDAYCLKPKELLRVFQSLRIVYYEEKKASHGARFDQTASLVAIKTE
ncbi:SAM-dependent methyltransferase [Desulfosarcina alkanivorans]|uniref:SAM-dependent methyltransferase n=1 Tax=Desulfosarcina alkanivorans TaxID=571177 RepID=A0A5K7YWF3_9BACT|nr:class I SAM-dependent methyltransferase [Desulfosarcina alkanivorans]BBO72379.1 SAM-dependent methyltransferase [Desulfosarcina alkanivorans]